MFKILNGLAPPHLKKNSQRDLSGIPTTSEMVNTCMSPLFPPSSKTVEQAGIHSNHSLKSFKKVARQEISQLYIAIDACYYHYYYIYFYFLVIPSLI